MRPLSISWAECSAIISCGKVDYDKSGWRGDGRQMWRLCMSDNRIQRRETRSLQASRLWTALREWTGFVIAKMIFIFSIDATQSHGYILLRASKFGDRSRNNSDGDCSRNNSDGDCSRNNSDGDCSRNNTDGDCSRNNSDGDCSHNNTDGDCSRNNSDGDRSRNNSDGDISRVVKKSPKLY
jgi:hypothetical protein